MPYELALFNSSGQSINIARILIKNITLLMTLTMCIDPSSMTSPVANVKSSYTVLGSRVELIRLHGDTFEDYVERCGSCG